MAANAPGTVRRRFPAVSISGGSYDAHPRCDRGRRRDVFCPEPQRRRTVFAWAGIGFIVLVVVASITIAEPINSKFRRLPEGQMPERAEHYRTLWRRFHAARNLAALAALACLAAAAVASDGGRRDLGFKAVVPSSAQTVCLLKNPRYFERDSHGAFFLTSALLAVQPPSSKMPSIGIVKYPDRACGTNA